jgi:adenylate cyclase
VAQDQEQIDSLKNVMRSMPPDSSRVNLLLVIARSYLNSNPAESIGYGKEARALARRIGFSRGAGFAGKVIGQGFAMQSKYAEAITLFQEALNTFDSIRFRSGVANMLSNIGGCYFNMSDDTKAIEFYLKALRVSEEINDRLRTGTLLNNIGGVYQNKAATHDKALEYFYNAIKICREIGYAEGVGYASMNIGEIYENRKQYDSAIVYFDASLNEFHGTLEATFPLIHLGEIYADKGNFSEALLYQNRALDIASGLDAKFEETQSLLGLAETQRKKGSQQLWISNLLKAVELAREVSAGNELKQAYEGLAKAYSSLGDFKKAYTYEALYSGIKDTLYNTANDKKVQQLQFNFDIEKKQSQIDLLTKDQALRELAIQRQKAISYAAGITGFLLLIMAVGAFNRYRYVQRTNKIISDEKERSETLLLNILPAETARELQADGYAKPRYYESVSVLFTDFKGFSSIAGKLSPQELVSELNEYFMAFDEIITTCNLEKIKTIGDAYMCAGGIPSANQTHALDTVNAALAMQSYMKKKSEERRSKGMTGWELRIGIHTGPIVSGVVGKKKYAYDIWGDTVNIASRMESNGEPGKVNISASTHDMIKSRFQCEYRGKISAKNIGEIDMYFVGQEIRG